MYPAAACRCGFKPRGGGGQSPTTLGEGGRGRELRPGMPAGRSPTFPVLIPSLLQSRAIVFVFQHAPTTQAEKKKKRQKSKTMKKEFSGFTHFAHRRR